MDAPLTQLLLDALPENDIRAEWSSNKRQVLTKQQETKACADWVSLNRRKAQIPAAV